MWRLLHLVLLLLNSALCLLTLPAVTSRVSVLSLAVPGKGLSEREMEIRRKIANLKREGRLKKDMLEDYEETDDVRLLGSVAEAYQSRIRQKLGDKESKLLGYVAGSSSSDTDINGTSEDRQNGISPMRKAQIGALPQPETVSASSPVYADSRVDRAPLINPEVFGSDAVDDVNEEALVDLVAQKLEQKRERERREKEAKLKQQAHERLLELAQERRSTKPSQSTYGVGGIWDKNETAEVELYQPKVGTWGAFPRPKDISKAYGGGRRVGPGSGNEEDRRKSEEDTRARLQRYREKVGIEVQSEKEHAGEIDEALKIAGYAMQRGVYATAVSALEKVTKYCSTNSKLGGKVFLELAMAYEAAGRTQEAITVYRTLSNCRIEEVKMNAKRLLYGIEAIQFMRDDVKSPEFSRKRAMNAFVDTTGLANIAQYFDNVYQTAYVDLEGGFYKRLTESVVRSAREARQILLQATDAGEVGRLRIVQALRSLSRKFEDALVKEHQQSCVQEPVAVMNGKPILRRRDNDDFQVVDEFILADPLSMMENLDGEWRLQLLADKTGDGVKFFNSTVSWQSMSTSARSFVSSSPSGFLTIQQTGKIEFNDKKRILRRRAVESTGGVVFSLFGGADRRRTGGALGAVSAPQQIISVDSVLLITRGVPNKRVRLAEEKGYFAVWRRVERGTYRNAP